MRGRGKAAQDAETIKRIRTWMAKYRRDGATHVGVSHVLDLLDPDGAWSYETGERREPVTMKPQAAEQPVIDPRADPVTGCLPVTADGS